MSVTLKDLDQLSSDSDDEEYIPEGGGISSEGSGSEGYCDAPVLGEDDPSGLGVTKARRKKGNSRKRKARSKVSPTEDEKIEEEGKEERDRARIDDLWASFKQDTASSWRKQTDNKGKDKIDEAAPPKKIKIQKTYDFAGEDIVVEKEVLADSKEAKKYLQSFAESSAKPSETDLPKTCSPNTPTNTTPSASSGSGRRSSGLNSVLKSLGKKSKLSTLEKSSMDWDKYKVDNKLEDELARNTKDGYLAKQEFLQWSDQKQFELERNERLKKFKKLH